MLADNETLLVRVLEGRWLWLLLFRYVNGHWYGQEMVMLQPWLADVEVLAVTITELQRRVRLRVLSGQAGLQRLDGTVLPLRMAKPPAHAAPDQRPTHAAVQLTPRGKAICDFAFRDGRALGLTDADAYAIAKRLIAQWDGTETLLQIYQRTEIWEDTIASEE
jgi:hypothetical protein